MSEEEYFGNVKDDEHESQLKVKWPSRAVNQIEWSVLCEMADALSLVEHTAPVLFIEDDEWANSTAYTEQYGCPMTAREALVLQDLVHGSVVERFRQQAVLARELGEHASLRLYLVACELEGIDPLIGKDEK